jgi:mannitol-specific phosphotransferase system IIBC component
MAVEAEAGLVTTPLGSAPVGAPGTTTTVQRTVNGRDVKKLVIACDAGMGSSVMVASAMRKKLAPYGVEVTHTPVNSIPTDAQLILTHTGLLVRAQAIAPASAVVVGFEQYMGDPAFTRVENAIKNGEDLVS